MKSEVNNYDGNINMALQKIDECVKADCDLICLPEAFATTLDLGGAKNISEEIPGKTSSCLCQKAKENNVHIVAGIMEKDEGKVYSTAILIDNQGEIIGKYRRAHIYKLEKHFISPGEEFKAFDTALGKIGLILGYDIDFPESCRILFRQGAQIIVCPLQIPNTFALPTVLLAKARAIENCCYFILASSVGENNIARLKYMGNSLIVKSPLSLDMFGSEYFEENDVIAQAGVNDPAVIYGDLDIEKIIREQEQNPHYADMLALSYGK